MNSHASSRQLLVFEYNGTARSGKGTIVSYLARSHGQVAVEETGVDYRAITRWLLSGGKINPTMEESEVIAVIQDLGLQALTEVVANRADIASEFGTMSFYAHDVNELVATIAKVELTRQSVKAGFKKRVESVRDKGEFKILLVDGRDLAKVLEGISNTRLLLRTFVTCSVVEAARRECLRSGIKLDSRAGKDIYSSIDKRTQADAQRQLDPVKPDTNAFDYWHPPNSENQAELGALAARNNRQIYFDTNKFAEYPDSKSAMCEAAKQMFLSALGELT